MAEITTLPFDALLMNTKEEPLRSKSFLSRFSNPLASHARNIFDLTIEPEDTFKVYSPGETVKGFIVLTVTKGFELTHLVVALQGYAKVYKHAVTPGRFPINEALLAGSRSKDFQYLGNGLASLFQDEQVVCGNGFLKKQVWKFGFELSFPNESLPSTIDFERGMVSYIVSVTLTRPTTIAPTTTKYKRLKFQDHIDIQSMYTPKMRFISLEPISRRGKVRKVLPASQVGTSETSIRSHLRRNSTHSSIKTTSTTTAANIPLSPALSEERADSITAASIHSFRTADQDVPNRKTSPQNSEARSSTTSSSLHNITATAEISRQGALPGDTVPIRVTITHNKPFVKGFVIATLYRQGRIDMDPVLPRMVKGKEKVSDHDNIYPRSRTGLGGLHFSNGAPSTAFRMDLGQSSTMMIINPDTLTADVTTSIKIPNSSFPTISNVPGGMIAFTYHVEVVIDLFGKLGETRLLPRLASSEPTFTHTANGGNQLSSEWSNNILDTSQLRRTKSVVTFDLSLVVGTADSTRKQMKSIISGQPGGEEIYHSSQDDWDRSMQENHANYDAYDDEYMDYDYQPQHVQAEGHDQHHPHHHMTLPHDFIPPPELNETVDEKTRLAQQEALLLPSQPPDEGESSSNGDRFAPTAPVIPVTEPWPATDRIVNDNGTSHVSSTSAPITSARSADTLRPFPMSPPPPIGSENGHVTDDKQELERQRLMLQTSAPPVEGLESNTEPALVPSAPNINDDEYNYHIVDEDTNQLPQYRR